jgi:signal transduction histidine kinase
MKPAAGKSLRLRLVLGVCLTMCVLWSSVAAWMFTSMRQELHSMLDDRLIASTRMVAGVVQQLQPAQQPGASRAPSADILSVIARDGVACEVSLVRSEVDIRPLAQTANSPGFGSLETPGFGHILKGGKAWRTYVLEENGIRIATADRIDVREHLVESFAYTLILPFLAALVGSLLLTWWCCTLGLRPLQRLQQELSRRPPRASSPVQAGQDVVELAPLVLSLNDLLGRMNAAIERERRWTADAAHELRTPLTAIKTHVQVAQLVLERAGFALPQAQAALQQAGLGITHMHATLEHLLLLARVESGAAQQGASTPGAALASAFEQACAQSRHQAALAAPAAGSAVAPELDIAIDHPAPWRWEQFELPVAAPLLTCAITNLTDNALRHHQGRAPVSARLALCAEALPCAAREGMASGTAAPMHLLVRIADRGPGLTAEECALATQRLWRKSSAPHGSGLGLTIVQRIAESAGGCLRLLPGTAQEPGLVAELRLPLLAAGTQMAQGLPLTGAQLLTQS